MPARLICRHPPASVASFVAAYTPISRPGRSSASLCGISRTMAQICEPVKVFAAWAGVHSPLSIGCSFCSPSRMWGHVVQVEVEGVVGGTAPGPNAGTGDRLSGRPFGDAGTGRAIVAGLGARQPVDGGVLCARRVGRCEREAVGQLLGRRAVEVDLELVTAFRMEAGWAPGAGE
jgi:hypothetical protein